MSASNCSWLGSLAKAGFFARVFTAWKQIQTKIVIIDFTGCTIGRKRYHS